MAHEMIAEESHGFVARVRLSGRAADGLAVPEEATARSGHGARRRRFPLERPRTERRSSDGDAVGEMEDKGRARGHFREVVVPIVFSRHDVRDGIFRNRARLGDERRRTASAPMDASSVIFIRDDDALPAFEFVASRSPRTSLARDVRRRRHRREFPRSPSYSERTPRRTRRRRGGLEAPGHRERHRAVASAHTSVEAIVRRVSGGGVRAVLHTRRCFSEDASALVRVALYGEIHWDTSEEDASSTSERRVSIPVDWSVVPDHAEIAVGMRLTAVAAATCASTTRGGAAVWIYGVRRVGPGFGRDEPAYARDAMSLSASSELETTRTTSAAVFSNSFPRSITRRSTQPRDEEASTSETGVGTEEVVLEVSPFDPRATIEVSAEGSGATATSRVGTEPASRVSSSGSRAAAGRA